MDISLKLSLLDFEERYNFEYSWKYRKLNIALGRFLVLHLRFAKVFESFKLGNNKILFQFSSFIKLKLTPSRAQTENLTYAESRQVSVSCWTILTRKNKYTLLWILTRSEPKWNWCLWGKDAVYFIGNTIAIWAKKQTHEIAYGYAFLLLRLPVISSLVVGLAKTSSHNKMLLLLWRSISSRHSQCNASCTLGPCLQKKDV